MPAAEGRTCTEDSRMLGGLTDHVPAVGGKHCALNCEGIGFRTAAGEHDVIRLCADQVGHLCPCGR